MELFFFFYHAVGGAFNYQLITNARRGEGNVLFIQVVSHLEFLGS